MDNAPITTCITIITTAVNPDDLTHEYAEFLDQDLLSATDFEEWLWLLQYDFFDEVVGIPWERGSQAWKYE